MIAPTTLTDKKIFRIQVHDVMTHDAVLSIEKLHKKSYFTKNMNYQSII